MKTVWLVRHCESMANAGHVTKDPSSIPLTELGEKQAELLLRSFPTAPNVIITSPFLRTQQSSIHIRNKFSQVPHMEWPVQEFSYLCLKKYQNTSIAQRQPAVKEYWEKCDPAYCDGDGAESFSDLIDRVYETLENINARSENFLAIFTHGQFMKVFWWMIKTSNIIFRNDTVRMKSAKRFINEIDIHNGTILKLKEIGNNKWDIQLENLQSVDNQ